jgi:hypothetical protein
VQSNVCGICVDDADHVAGIRECACNEYYDCALAGSAFAEKPDFLSRKVCGLAASFHQIGSG